MASKRSKDIILKYVRTCKGNPTKNDTVRYMESLNVPEPDRTSRITTLTLIEELELSGSLKVARGKRIGQSHRLIFNDRSNFNILTDEINRMEMQVNDSANTALVDLIRNKKNKNNSFKKHYRNLLLLAQLAYYARIASIGTEINQYIESADDREALFLRLAQVLTISNKLNKAIILAFQPDLNDTLNELRELKKFRPSLEVDRVEQVIRSTRRNLSTPILHTIS